MQYKKQIDIIIPCLNESRYLPKTLAAIKNIAKKSNLQANIIVVDNGSTDNSRKIAKDFGIKVMMHEGVSIGKLRNIGAHSSSGNYLIFLDADIEITNTWLSALSSFISSTNKNEFIVTGYQCQASPHGSMLERYWFGNIRPSSNYINSGNLITTRKLFEAIKGFNVFLETGEDWDFCQRAKEVGAKLAPNPDFKVYHLGFPKTPKSFFLRELWHGCGDCNTLIRFTKSKPAMLGFFAGVLFFLGIFLLICFKSPTVFLLFLIYLLMTGTALSIKRSKRIRQVPLNIFFAIIYIYARFGSLLIAIWRKFVMVKPNKMNRWR